MSQGRAHVHQQHRAIGGFDAGRDGTLCEFDVFSCQKEILNNRYFICKYRRLQKDTAPCEYDMTAPDQPNILLIPLTNNGLTAFKPHSNDAIWTPHLNGWSITANIYQRLLRCGLPTGTRRHDWATRLASWRDVKPLGGQLLHSR